MTGKRRIFEEVDAGARVNTPLARGGIARAGRGARRKIRLWLMVLFALLVAMIAVGGLTRLTDSGLSITDWHPVTGVIPPLNAADWAAEFAKYQTSPQFHIENSTMTLAQFKGIFWWEWSHRLLGRLIGLVWALGFVGFWLSGRIPVGWTGRLLGLGVLGGFQGLVGWWMVSSGLTGRMISVASYRLAIHLGIAFVILGLIGWFAMLLGRSEADLLRAHRAGEGRLRRWSTGLLAMIYVQVLLGALVAGIDAGRAFPTWPLMNGAFLPPESFDLTPLWSNFFENMALVQFDHRLWGYLLFVCGLALWGLSRGSPNRATRRAFTLLALWLVAQMALGIFTALTLATPHIAITHQLGAVLLYVLILRARFLSIYPQPQSVRNK